MGAMFRRRNRKSGKQQNQEGQNNLPLRLELLEDRILLSTVVLHDILDANDNVTATQLWVTGDSDGDNLELRIKADDTSKIEVLENGNIIAELVSLDIFDVLE